MLRLSNLSVMFGGLAALSDVNLNVDKPGVVGLIGPNGAGKSTLLNVISGVIRATQGQVEWMGQDLTRLATHRVIERGIARTFQNIEADESGSVIDNVVAGCLWRYRSSLFSELLNLPGTRQKRATARLEAIDTLEFLDLAEYANHVYGELSYGIRKRIEVARAIVSHPRLLLLDEPAAGLSTREASNLGILLKNLQRERNLLLFVIEHNMRLIMDISDRIVVLNQGRLIADDTPDAIRLHGDVIQAYLGG